MCSCAQMNMCSCAHRFEHMFVGCKSVLDVTMNCGMGFSAVDATGCKHLQYRNGTIHMITTRDGDNKLIPVAWSFSQGESGDSYEFFARSCVEFGLGEYLNQDYSCLFSDRDKGVPTFHLAFEGCYNARCFLHIIKNCRKYLRQKKSGHKISDEHAWMLQRAKTREEWECVLLGINAVAPLAAEYFRDRVHHPHAYRYAFHAVP